MALTLRRSWCGAKGGLSSSGGRLNFLSGGDCCLSSSEE